MFCKVFAYALLGLMIAAPVLLPNIMSILQSDRLYAEIIVPKAYPWEYYVAMPAALISQHATYCFFVSVGAVAMMAVFVLFSLPWKRYLYIKLALGTLLIFAMIPSIGSALNGFGHATNRWIWVLVFLLCYITAVILPEVQSITKRQGYIIMGLTAVYTLICLVPETVRMENTYFALVILIVSVILSIAFANQKFSAGIYYGLLLTLTMSGNIFNGIHWAAPEYHNWVDVCVESGGAISIYDNEIWDELDDLLLNKVNRFDVSQKYIYYNSAMLHEGNGTSGYFSTVSSGISSFYKDQLLNTNMPQWYNGLNGRSYLDAAMGVAYYIEHRTSIDPKPYGYDIEADNFREEANWKIFASRNTLPIVYAFDGVCNNFRTLSVTQKQQALLQCAMTDEITTLPQEELLFEDYDVPFEIVSMDHVSIDEDGQFLVEEDNAYVTLHFDRINQAELYLIIKNLQFQPYEKTTQTKISIQAENRISSVDFLTPENDYYCNRHDFLLNTGYSEGTDTLKIMFSVTGAYRFDMFVTAQPLDSLSQLVENLANSGIHNISVGTNMISFESLRSKPGVACIAVPYQNGWHASVNGIETDVVCIQDGLCGVLLPTENATVVMTYRTPGLQVGIILCLLGLIIVVLIMKRRI